MGDAVGEVPRVAHADSTGAEQEQPQSRRAHGFARRPCLSREVHCSHGGLRAGCLRAARLDAVRVLAEIRWLAPCEQHCHYGREGGKGRENPPARAPVAGGGDRAIEQLRREHAPDAAGRQDDGECERPTPHEPSHGGRLNRQRAADHDARPRQHAAAEYRGPERIDEQRHEQARGKQHQASGDEREPHAFAHDEHCDERRRQPAHEHEHRVRHAKHGAVEAELLRHPGVHDAGAVRRPAEHGEQDQPVSPEQPPAVEFRCRHDRNPPFRPCPGGARPCVLLRLTVRHEARKIVQCGPP